MSIDWSEEHPENAETPIRVNLERISNVTEESEAQALKP
jgi:hypothetical protein